MFKVNAVFTGGKNYNASIPPHILANIAAYKLEHQGSTCLVAQRTFKEKHCRFIADGNAEAFNKGMYLPHHVMISIDDAKLLRTSKSGKTTLLLPETNDEIVRYAAAFDVLDAQHRIMSFHPKYRRKDTPVDYKLTVTVVDRPTDEEKVYYFNLLNTGSKTPDKDLICQHARMLSDNKKDKEFQNIYDLLFELNSTQGILRHAIRIGNHEGGGRLLSIASLCNSHLTNDKGVNLDEALISMNCNTTEKKAVMMRKYLFAWNDFFANGANRFDMNSKERYRSKNYSIFALQFAAPVFVALAKYNNKRWDTAKVNEMFALLKTILGIKDDISEITFKNSGAADRNRFAHDTIDIFEVQVATCFATNTAAAKNTSTAPTVVVNGSIISAQKSTKKSTKKTANAAATLKAKV